MGDLWRRGPVELTWKPGSEFHGLVVTCRRRPLGELLDEWATAPAGDDRPWRELSAKEKITRLHAQARDVATLIVAWNLSDDAGEPIPWPPIDPMTMEPVPWPPAPGDLGERSREIATEAVLRHCDDDMISGMRAGYVAATMQVAPPLDERSESGPSEAPPAPEDWTPATLPAAQEVTAPIDHPV